MKNKTKMLSIVLAIVMILTSVSIGVPTFAASKPSATQITSIKAIENGFTVKWKKKPCTGYQVQYSTSKKFTSKTSKTLKVNKAKTTSKTVKKLKAKKKYYVRVRTYKTVKKKNYYSKWSANYSVTTKAKKVLRAVQVILLLSLFSRYRILPVKTMALKLHGIKSAVRKIMMFSVLLIKISSMMFIVLVQTMELQLRNLLLK